MSASEDPVELSERRRERIERWRPRMLAVWTVVGVFIASWLIIGALGFVQQALGLILVGGVAGFMCSPVTNRLEDHKVPRGLAALISLALLVVGVIVLVSLIGGPLMQELLVLLRSTPVYIEQAQRALGEFWNTYGESADPRVQSTVNQLVSALSSTGLSMASDLARQISTGLVENISSMVTDFTTVFLGLVLAYWVAKDYPLMARELAVIVGPRHSRDVTLMLAVLLGLFVGPGLAFAALVITVVAQNIADNVLSPVVMQRSVQIHPALSLVGIIVGGCLGGALGMVLAVPLTAAIRGFFVYFFETRTGRQIVSSTGALFRGTEYKEPDGSPCPELDALDDATFFEGSRLRGALSEEDRAAVEGHAAGLVDPRK